MNAAPYSAEGTGANFQTLVIANSAKGPVAVNFWSPRAEPCMMLMPRLVAIHFTSPGWRPSGTAIPNLRLVCSAATTGS